MDLGNPRPAEDDSSRLARSRTAPGALDRRG